MMGIFDYTDVITFKSHLPPGEAKASLAARTRRSYWEVFLSGDMNELKSFLIGKFGSQSVCIYRIIVGWNYSLTPVFYGKFIEKDGVTLLQGKFTIFFGIKIFAYLFWAIGFLIVGTVSFTLISASSAEQIAGMLFMVPVLLIISLPSLVPLIFKRFSESNIELISKEIESALN